MCIVINMFWKQVRNRDVNTQLLEIFLGLNVLLKEDRQETFLHICPSWLPIPGFKNIMTESSLEKIGFVPIYTLQPINRGGPDRNSSKAGACGQARKQNHRGMFFQTDWACFLIHPQTACPGVAQRTGGWALTPQLSMKQTPHRPEHSSAG